MKRSSLSAFILVLLVSNSPAASEPALPDGLQEYVAVHYHAANPAPRHLLFESYVQTVHHKSQLGDGEATHYVVDTLGLGHDPDGEVRAAEIVVLMQRAFASLSDGNLEEKYEILCSIDPFERSNGEIVRAFNTMDDVGNLLARKQFRISISLLRKGERKRMIQHLDRLSESFFYVSFDHRFLLEPSATSPQELLAGVCDRLATANTYIS